MQVCLRLVICCMKLIFEPNSELESINILNLFSGHLGKNLLHASETNCTINYVVLSPDCRNFSAWNPEYSELKKLILACSFDSLLYVKNR